MAKQISLLDVNPSKPYDLDNDNFLAFFRKTTGYCLTDCECGWEKVKMVLANPSVPIETLSFTNRQSGSPLSENEIQSMRNSWAMTRQKLQDQWDIFTGVKTFNEVYRARLSS